MNSPGLYRPEYEHDNCGVGFVANIDGRRDHAIIEHGLSVLENLIHRGAVGGDGKTGDGAGMLVQLPDAFFRRVLALDRVLLPPQGEYGAGMLFVERTGEAASLGHKALALAAEELGLPWIGLRTVPTDPDCLGELALAGMPHILQFFVGLPSGVRPGDDFERDLYLMRRTAEKKMAAAGFGRNAWYVCSLSSRTIVYKGLFVGAQIRQFYPDLSAPDFASCLALVHQRYSTNTFPTWSLAQPFRFVAHNGEINTLRGNINKMRARESTMSSPLFGEDIERIRPVIDPDGSDSAVFDNVYELLTRSGRSIEHAMMMMIPEAFGVKYHISQDKRAFYEYHANFMEPWDGPAAMVFTDGIRIGATLDRNGLRPCRYTLTSDGFMVLASECGVLEIEPSRIIKKGRLMPGKMFVIDTVEGRLIDDNEIKSRISRQKPYRHWLDRNRIELKGLFGTPTSARPDQELLRTKQILHGYSYEQIEHVLRPMARDGQEPVSSMGTDASLAILSNEPQLLFNYFKQLFAQVTNPPIDPIREGLVMTLTSFIGRDRNLLDESPEHCRKLKLPHPILTNDDLARIKASTRSDFKAVVLPAVFPADGGDHALEQALKELCINAAQIVEQGADVLILSDRKADRDHAPIPSLLASAAVHHHLIKKGLRSQTGLIVESAEPREVMHFALLAGYGVNAINPWLAFETITSLADRGALGDEIPDSDEAIDHYITAIKKGLLKIFSKMGISTLRSYQSAQIFEAIGLAPALVERYFTNTPSRIGGIGLREIQQETLARHRQAWAPNRVTELLPIGGQHRVRVKTENHLWTPQTIRDLQLAVINNDLSRYRDYAHWINEQEGHTCTLRGLFRFKAGNAVPLDEVEPATAIMKRFATGAMSFGSISREAHESLAIAMNMIGGKSNTGEGGEEARRFLPRPDGTSARSAIKQVASARFGVTAAYLVNADEIQIKMAQGAKPGEGGQLPGHKVDRIIASVRHSTPGVTLISPPPHHDIYSIEDLAQLIFDLRSINPRARISVKLVAEAGVGTVAAGVAKAGADMVLISGHDGGTGASPMSSILHAGIPWELGLAETQQTLVKNHLRNQIVVQTDGQLKTGRDVVIAALLGAEEFGFATAPLVTQGCIMMRKCHKNTCPVGVATQDAELRKNFRGKPEYLVNYFHFVAEEIREQMATLGFRSMDEMIGRSDLLQSNPEALDWKTGSIDLSGILEADLPTDPDLRRCTRPRKHVIETELDRAIHQQTSPAVENGTRVECRLPVKNSDRSVGALLSGRIALKYGDAGLPEQTIRIHCTGSAGQSFGAFLARGIELTLEGEANDYLGKSLSGGVITVIPPAGATFRPEENIIAGNTLLYGATSGQVFIRGMVGERFAVRNSGATAVVEGVGDHGCEYMTGGTVVVLGKTGRNFAAGMSGGIAYVLDTNQLFDTLCNLDMVDIEPVTAPADIDHLKGLVSEHANRTGSRLANKILAEWRETLPRFVKVMPQEYKKALQTQLQDEHKDTESVSVTEEVFKHG